MWAEQLRQCLPHFTPRQHIVCVTPYEEHWHLALSLCQIFECFVAVPQWHKPESLQVVSDRLRHVVCELPLDQCVLLLELRRLPDIWRQLFMECTCLQEMILAWSAHAASQEALHNGKETTTESCSETIEQQWRTRGVILAQQASWGNQNNSCHEVSMLPGKLYGNASTHAKAEQQYLLVLLQLLGLHQLCKHSADLLNIKTQGERTWLVTEPEAVQVVGENAKAPLSEVRHDCLERAQVCCNAMHANYKRCSWRSSDGVVGYAALQLHELAFPKWILICGSRCNRIEAHGLKA
mmetsp:Transcript_25477/g.58748  ORF Transcript_25477/g.58748 Transcript_25477/m.58748 type:complete len:294 (-) Transcript_25477:484-1365(-)